MSQTLGPFNNTHRRHCVEVPLIDDTFCESNPYPEDFSVVMTTTNTEVTVVPTRIGVAVDDRLDPECSKTKTMFTCCYFCGTPLLDEDISIHRTFFALSVHQAIHHDLHHHFK